MGGKEGEELSFLVCLLIRTLILVSERPTFMTSFTLITSRNALSPNVATLGLEASIYEFAGHKSVQISLLEHFPALSLLWQLTQSSVEMCEPQDCSSLRF